MRQFQEIVERHFILNIEQICQNEYLFNEESELKRQIKEKLYRLMKNYLLTISSLIRELMKVAGIDDYDLKGCPINKSPDRSLES